MKTYRVSITASRFPTDYEVKASNFATAVARAVKLWRKRFKGQKESELRIHAVQSQEPK